MKLTESRPSKHAVGAALLALVLCLAGPAVCQDSTYNSTMQPGFPMNSTFQGDDFLSVSLNNLSLHINIPLFNQPGRGLSMGGSLMYDSSSGGINPWGEPGGYAALTSGDPLTFQGLVPTFTPGFGIEDDSYSETTIDCEDCDPIITVEVDIHTLYAIDAAGTRHIMLPYNVQLPTPDYPTGEGVPTTLYAGDGSGYVIQYNDAVPTLYDKHGNFTSHFGTFEDSNGNQILNAIPSSPDALDTVGRQHALDGSYTDAAGVLRQLQVTFVPVSEVCLEYDYPSYLIVPCTLNYPGTVTLPNGQSYTITYTSGMEGEIQSITVPSGATYSFEYGDFFTTDGSVVEDQVIPPTSNCAGVNGRPVTKKTVSVPPPPNSGRTAPDVYVWNYSFSCSTGTPYTATVTVTDPSGNDLEQVNPAFTYGGPPVGPQQGPAVYTYSTRTQYSGTGSSRAALDTTETTYANYFSGATNLAQPVTVTNTLNDGEVSETDTDYENFTVNNGADYYEGPFLISFGNPTSVWEYGYGAGAPGSLLKETATTYLHDTNSGYLNANIVDRPTSVTVSGPSLAAVSVDKYGYDEYSGANGSPLFGAPEAINHDPAYSSTYTLRGNVTSHSRQVSTGVFDMTKMQYDVLGNVVVSTDPKGTPTYISYADHFTGANCTVPAGYTYAYPTSITTAGQQEQKTYYNCTGQVANDKSPNDVASGLSGTTVTYDNVLRPTLITKSNGATMQMSYADLPVNPSVTTTTTAAPSPNVVQTTYYDGLHRPSSVVLGDGSTTRTEYDQNGKVALSYRPYKGTQAGGYTQTQYDALGRPVYLWDTGTLTGQYTYAGSTTTFKDEAMTPHIQVSDALGRLTKVFEANPNGGANYETDYQYDALGNLLDVMQHGDGTQTIHRYFTYDGESRLLTAFNPESGFVCYGTSGTGGSCAGGYDPNGNLSFKTDANGNQTQYQYDPLNRLTQKTYLVSPAASAALWQSSCYAYDSSPNGVGKLASEWTQAGQTCSTGGSYITKHNFLAYDTAQNLTDEQQCTPGYCTPALGASNELHSNYDLAGRLLSYNNGASATGYNFTQAYDMVGRLTNVTQADPFTPVSLFTVTAFTPASAIEQMMLGPTITATRSYDGRQRITGEIASTPNGQ